jgi:hypothetical protein
MLGMGARVSKKISEEGIELVLDTARRLDDEAIEAIWRAGKTLDNADGIPLEKVLDVAPVSGLRTTGDVVGAINHNADVAVELARRAVARGRISSGPQTFGTRAHMYFERLNRRLDRSLSAEGNSLTVAAEEFRNSAGIITATRALGSIGADAIIRDTADSSLLRIFDLKTHGGTLLPISPARQSEFMRRFGDTATEIFRHR